MMMASSTSSSSAASSYNNALDHVQGVMGGFGRPASMDMGDIDVEAERFRFNLSPPPSMDLLGSARPFQQQQNGVPKGKERIAAVSQRTYPAPLLLSRDRDRPFGGTSSPVPTTAPLALRKSSVSAGSTPSPSNGMINNNNNGSTPPAGVPGQQSSSRYPWGSSSASTTTPPGSLELSSQRSTPPFQRHRSQNSSQLSQSQSSITYTHSHDDDSTPATSAGGNHSVNTSVSSNVTVSPVMSHAATMGSLALASASASLAASSSGQAYATPPPTTTQPHSHATSMSDPPLSSQALLLYILALRSNASSTTSHSPPMSLSQSQASSFSAPAPTALPNGHHNRVRSGGSSASNEITSSLSEITPTVVAAAAVVRAASPVVRRDSEPTKLDTVDLSHKRIADVSPEVIHELKDEVEKLALGYNLLRELPGEFQKFAKLRYLNVRVNLLTTFPQVLCEMPSLEILDISRNKIKKLPVFSITKNRIKRLPAYIAQMSHLRVLKVDHNPLEWPPKEISTFPVNGGSASGSVGNEGDARKVSKGEDADEMQRWLQMMCRWMRDNPERRPHQTSLTVVDHPLSDEERSEDPNRPGGMTRSESGRLVTSPPTNPNVSRLRTAPPPNGRSFIDEDPTVRLHSRNASHSTVPSNQDAEPRNLLRAKKSLPDLRQSHADILAERRTAPNSAEDDGRPKAASSGSASALRRLKQDKHPGILQSQSARAVLTTAQVQERNGGGPPSRSTSPVSLHPRSTTPQPRPPLSTSLSKTSVAAAAPTPRRPGTPTSAVGPEFDLKAQTNLKRTEMERTPSGGFDRNSGAYFRRLSMLPASTISKTVPVTLLEFADAIRGILFSLSQIYTALRQFVVFASQDRLPAPLARLMGSADGAMSLLINALDRFDSLSRRGTPSPVIVRDIFVTCHDNVVMFGRLVAALAPELKALVSTADVRYTRTLLLMLYGSTGEIANSWNKVAPLLSEMSDLSDDPSLATLILQPPTPSPTLSGSLSSRPSPGPNGTYRSRSKTRRHAGSFSVEDVQLGAVLPPAGSDAPGGAAGADPLDDEHQNGGGTLKARTTKSSRNGMTIKLPNTLAPRDMIVNAFEQPLTPGPTGLLFGENGIDSAGSLNSSTSSSSTHFLPQSAPPAFLSRGNGNNENVPRMPVGAGVGAVGTTSYADEQFLAMVDATTSIAYDVYGMLLESFDEAATGRGGEGASALIRELGPRRTKELTDLCILGNEVTTKLSGSWGRVRGIDKNAPLKFSSADAKRLGEDSYTFVQTVIRFAKLVKAISLEHGFAPQHDDVLPPKSADFSRQLDVPDTELSHEQEQGTMRNE
ncbi:hypothetical protein RQP46_006834 [Phenoliferia psychrophenolica]